MAAAGCLCPDIPAGRAAALPHTLACRASPATCVANPSTCLPFDCLAPMIAFQSTCGAGPPLNDSATSFFPICRHATCTLSPNCPACADSPPLSLVPLSGCAPAGPLPRAECNVNYCDQCAQINGQCGGQNCAAHVSAGMLRGWSWAQLLLLAADDAAQGLPQAAQLRQPTCSRLSPWSVGLAHRRLASSLQGG